MHFAVLKACIVNYTAKRKARPFYQYRRALMEKVDRFDRKPSKGFTDPLGGKRFLGGSFAKRGFKVNEYGNDS